MTGLGAVRPIDPSRSYAPGPWLGYTGTPLVYVMLKSFCLELSPIFTVRSISFGSYVPGPGRVADSFD